MPIYEYRCTTHGHRFEIFQPVGAGAPPCPECGSPTRKVYASVGLIFKGSGFHTTDYRHAQSGDGKAAAPDAAGAASGDGAANRGGAEGSKQDPAKVTGESGGSKGSASSGTAKEGGSGKPTGAAKT